MSTMIDASIVVAYFLWMLVLGWRSRGHSADSYWVAGRASDTGAITASLVATIFGASSTIGLIGLGYSRGLTGAWWALIGGLALVPFGLVLARRVRQSAAYTLPDMLERAYGEKVAIPAGVMIVAAWCGIVAAQILAGVRLLHGVFSVDVSWATVSVAVVFIVYTYWGGQRSVIRTDIWQIVLFVGGLLLSLCLLAASYVSDRSLWGNVPSDHLRFPVSSAFGWYDLLAFYPLIVGLPYLVGPDIYSRMLCSRDDEVARRSALMGAAAVVPLSFLLALTGVLIRGRFPGLAPDAALPATMSGLVPVGLRGLIAASFLAAVMSSADTTLMSAATILSLNVVGPLARLTRAQRFLATRYGILLVGGISCFIASIEQGIISSLLLGYTLFVGGVALPTLASFWSKRLGITPTGAAWSILLGGGTAILGSLQGGDLLRGLVTETGDAALRAALGPRYASLLPLVVSLAALVVASRMSREHQ